jgi:hypothetical protein
VLALIQSRIFQDSSRNLNSTNSDADEAADYFKEILLSYRLIFGQTKDSHRGFNRLLPEWSRNWNWKTTDPMLSSICGHYCESEESRAVYDAIDADDPSTHYSPVQDFPYLGRRLEILQAYVKNHRPKTFGALWHDDRDVGFWWTFWVRSK